MEPLLGSEKGGDGNYYVIENILGGYYSNIELVGTLE